MPKLVWDNVGSRVYETGLDQGVLYLPDGSAVPWNGLTSVIEHFDRERSPVYFDGMKINDLVIFGDFSASMKAVTYPDEFVELEGMAATRRGLFFTDQQVQAFGLCYRTQIGNDLEGEDAGYKIHLVYNVTAIPSDKTYASRTSEPSLVEFEWNISAVPEEVPGFRPTAHVVIDSRDVDPWLLEDLEEMLYGSSNAEAALIPMPTLVTYINEWYRIKIVDNGDGTWKAISQRDGMINIRYDDFFTIIGANVWYVDDVTYVISDTKDISDVPQIKIVDHGDGSWSATTDHDNLINLYGDEFEILNANAVYINDTLYEVSDTPDEG